MIIAVRNRSVLDIAYFHVRKLYRHIFKHKQYLGQPFNTACRRRCTRNRTSSFIAQKYSW
jgi:hypothetical protein